MPRTDTDKAFVKNVYAPGISTDQMGKYNRMKYAKMPPPPVELITKVQEGTGLSQHDFEFMYGIPTTTISLVRNGRRNMPKPYWHIFYDFDNLHNIIKDVSACINKKIKNNAIRKKKVLPNLISEGNLQRLNKLNGSV